MTPLRRRMIDDMTLHGFKRKTITAYVACVARFARHFGKSPEVLGTAEIRSYLLYLTHDRHVSASTYNQALCALKFLYRVTLGKDWGLDGLARCRHQLKLPVVMSIDEVTRFFQAIPTLRHRAILMTAYAAGLRIAEVLALRVDDIDSRRMVIRVRQGKGSKDRYVMLSPRLLTLLRDYWKANRRRKAYQPSPWLFPGNVPGQPITDRAVYEACEEACRAAGLDKHVTVHTLRHTFAPTCWRAAPTCGPSRSCSAIAASTPPLGISMWPPRRCNRPAARWIVSTCPRRRNPGHDATSDNREGRR